MSRKGRIFIVSAPSGAGKTTLCHAVLKRFPEMVYSISATTRAPRENEKDGVDYYFLSVDAFKKKIDQDALAEWAEVHGNFYGTLRETIEKNIFQGKDVLLDVDVKGAAQIQTRYDDCVLIFIMPPSLSVLRERLGVRATDSSTDIEKRMKNAEEEMAMRNMYHHVIVNDRLETARNMFIELIETYGRHELKTI